MTNRKALTYVMENFALPDADRSRQEVGRHSQAHGKPGAQGRHGAESPVACEARRDGEFLEVQQLKDSGAIVRTEDKGVAYFSLANPED